MNQLEKFRAGTVALKFETRGDYISFVIDYNKTVEFLKDKVNTIAVSGKNKSSIVMYCNETRSFKILNKTKFTKEGQEHIGRAIEVFKPKQEFLDNRTVVKLRNGNVCCLLRTQAGSLSVCAKNKEGGISRVASVSHYRNSLENFKTAEHDIMAMKLCRDQVKTVNYIMTNTAPSNWDFELKTD